MRPKTVCGASTVPVRTFQGRGCGATFRPDDAALGGPEGGACPADGRSLSAPVAAERPPRVAHDLVARCTGVPLSSGGAPGIIDSPAEALKLWQAERETRAAEAVGEALASGDGPAERRVESARDGVTAPMDGRWPPPQGAPLLGRRLEAPAEEPTLGTVLARRDVRVLGAAADLAARLKPGLREARGAPIPSGELLGDGAPGIWNVADAHGPGVRQTRDSDHLREHL